MGCVHQMGRVTCVQLLRESIYPESMRNVEGSTIVVYHRVFSTGCYVVICYVNSSIRVVDGRMVVLPPMRSLDVCEYDQARHTLDMIILFPRHASCLVLGLSLRFRSPDGERVFIGVYRTHPWVVNSKSCIPVVS